MFSNRVGYVCCQVWNTNGVAFHISAHLTKTVSPGFDKIICRRRKNIMNASLLVVVVFVTLYIYYCHAFYGGDLCQISLGRFQIVT